MQTLNDENFQDFVNENECVLVKFGADWCGPCKQVEAMIKPIESKFSFVRFTNMNADESQETFDKFNVSLIPTIVLFKNGEVFWQHTGLLSLNKLEDKLNEM